MGQDQRKAVSVSGPLMNEVDLDTVDFGAEVLEPVQLTLSGTPVELVAPVREQPLQVFEVGPLTPGRAWRRIGPARGADALSEIREDLRLDVNREWRHAKGRFHGSRLWRNH